MKKVVSISLGSNELDYNFKTSFLGQKLQVSRLGTNRDTRAAGKLLRESQGKADALGLGMVPDHYSVGTSYFPQRITRKLEKQAGNTPVTTGARLREIVQEWSLRSAQEDLSGFFTNAKVLFLSGSTNYRMAAVMAEYTQNLAFADPVLQFGAPNLLHSLRALELYAAGSNPILSYTGGKAILPSITPGRYLNRVILKKAIQDADVIVATYDQLQRHTSRELTDKTVLTSTISPERLAVLREKGVRLAVDCSIQLFDQTVGLNVVEAMIIAALEKEPDDILHDDYLEIFTDLDLKPRILYPIDGKKQINRFAFVIHPLSQKYLNNLKPLEMISKVSPSVVMDMVEKAAAHTPPFIYSTMDGIVSPTGVEAKGWLIIVGGTPKEIMSHSPEFTYRQLLAAADMAKKLGAQIMGLGAFTKVVGDAGVTVAKRAPLPITTGNSYSASGALWAAHDAVARLGLVKLKKGERIDGKAMVVGATGAIGAACARLLARTTRELHLVSPESAKLLVLKKSILKASPGVKLVLSHYADSDKSIGDMDMIVTATSGAGRKILDIMKVKPGCVITDVARPLDLPAEEVARRPDVLVIESGEVYLPGDVKVRNIGFEDRHIVYACLAETIVLTLEGRFENFTVGRNIEWEKVHEIYKLGLRHGMKLAAISGVNGVFSDEDIARVRKLALRARKTWPGGPRNPTAAAARTPAKRRTAAGTNTPVKKRGRTRRGAEQS
jgi:predicted amino acid dehydrogenase